MIEFLGQPRQVQRALRRGHQVIEREIAVATRHRGCCAVGASKPSACAVIVAVDRKAGAGQRRAAERALVQPRARIGEARAVARGHLVIGHQVVAERHRLRGLQVGEAGHDAVGMLAGAGRPARAAARRARHRPGRSRRAPTAGSRSRPGRCGCARCGAARRPGRSARPAGSRWSCGCPRAPSPRARRRARIRRRPASSPASIAVGILARDDALRAPSIATCALLRGDVLPPQRLVERDRGVDLAHDRAGPFGEAPAPHPVGARHAPIVRRSRSQPRSPSFWPGCDRESAEPAQPEGAEAAAASRAN